MGRSTVRNGKDPGVRGGSGLGDAEGGFAASFSGMVGAEILRSWLGSGERKFSPSGFVPGAVADRGGGWMTSFGRMVVAAETLPGVLWSCGLIELRRSGMTMGDNKDG